jgi:hypothetical protein
MIALEIAPGSRPRDTAIQLEPNHDDLGQVFAYYLLSVIVQVLNMSLSRRWRRMAVSTSQGLPSSRTSFSSPRTSISSWASPNRNHIFRATQHTPSNSSSSSSSSNRCSPLASNLRSNPCSHSNNSLHMLSVRRRTF